VILLLCVAGLFLAAGLCWLAALTHFVPGGLITGLFCGALNNTPALAAAVETAKSEFAAQPELPDQIIIGYGIVYPFSVIALLMFHQRLIRREKPQSPAVNNPASSLTMLPAVTVRISSSQPDGSPWTVAALNQATGAIVSRFRTPEGKERVALPDAILPPGTDVVVIANPGQLADLEHLAGKRTPEHLELVPEGIQVCRYMVTNHEISEHSLAWLQKQLVALGAVITRVRQ
jgi:putative transport protein